MYSSVNPIFVVEQCMMCKMRYFDFVSAFIGTLVLFPLFLITAILIKLSSPGPIFYLHERVGLNGRRFRLYKFRSMVANADKIGTSVTTVNDPRITKVGKFIRNTKLDELPQLFNILKGDMSFVGPRPDVPEIVNKYSPEMKRILSIRPGITSNATLHLRHEEELLAMANDPDRAYEMIFVPAKVRLAMEHVNRRSFLFDFGILLKTVWALIGGRIFPMKEHPIVNKIRHDIERMNNNQNENCLNLI